MPNIAHCAQQFDGLQHIVKIMGRLTHAHEDHFFHGPHLACQGDLRHHFTASQLANQTRLTGHAKHTTDRTPDLTGHTQPIAWQQHTFNRLTV